MLFTVQIQPDPNTGYPAYIDVDSFVDYIIHNELARQGDSYMRSTRMFKDAGGTYSWTTLGI